MYSASTMSGAHYMNPNGVNPMAYQQNVSTSSYGMPMGGGADAAQAYAMHQQQHPTHPMQHWNPADYYQQQQQHQAYAQQQQAQQVQQQKGVKRKPTNNSERPNKMPYNHHTPQFAFSQAAPTAHLDPTTMSSMTPADDYRLQQPQLNGHLSPYRYSPGSAGSPYWPAGGRPPSRSEIVRMELRNSLQAKQVANQQRQPIPLDVPAPVSNDSSQSSSAPGIGADSLGFDLDIVLKDSDGSLMDAELDTVFDWKLVGGCGFDMDNESTKCLVMQLLS